MVLSLVLSALLSVPTVRAQTLSSDGSLNWGVSTTGPSTSSVSGTNLVILAGALTVGLVATGGVPAAVAATGRALTVLGSVVGPIAANALRQMAARGALTGTALALALAMAGDTYYDPATNSFLTKRAQPGASANLACKDLAKFAETYGYYQYGGNKLWGWYIATNQSPGNVTPPGGYGASQGYFRADGICDPNSGGYNIFFFPQVVQNPPPANTTPATDAALGAALSTPAALGKVWDAFGCGPKITTFRDTASADDPCAQIVGAPGAGGRTWTPVSVPNGGAVTFPGRTETTTDGQGHVVGTRTTVPTAQVTPNTNQATMGATPVTVTPGQTVTTTTTNADGSTTTTTTTTTNPAQTTPQQTDGTATFSAGDATIYTKKSRTWNDVLLAFQNSLKAAPWYQAASNFFTVSISASQCPHWSMPANKWMPALDAGQFVCSSTMVGLYQLGGAVVMIVAAWAAFRIAFL
ncbi:MAG: hypothetical protein INH13_03260 [Cupriavidus sp.]|nr:hypothetical protein [Cupriavidus sp.]